MSEALTLPYFVQGEHDIKYLGQHSYLETDGINLASPIGQRVLLAEGICVNELSLPTDRPSEGRILAALEPHPDDLALSASGYAMSAIAAGGICRSMNLFSRTAIDRFPWHDKVNLTEEELEDLRLQESNLAVGDFLGQQFTSLRLPLASKRGYEEIFADTHHDQGLVRQVSDELTDTIVEDGVDTVLCPLAVQGHIDHLVTFDVGMSIKRNLGNEIDLILYEDYPYTRNKRAYSQRLQKVSDMCRLGPEYLNVDDFLDSMADMAIIYRSQFDDINRDQMHAVMREDLRATALEARVEGAAISGECAQRYWRVYER